MGLFIQDYFYVEIIISLLFCVFVYYFMCVFILGEWITPTVVGDRPPPIDEFTLTSITNNTAVLFGGTTTNYHNNKVYFINFTKTSVVSWYLYIQLSERNSHLCFANICVSLCVALSLQ